MKISWEWIGGFFEGEGNISWRWPKEGTKQGVSGRIIIGQNDKRPLTAIKEFLKEQGYEHSILYLRPGAPNPTWILVINERNEVIRFLDSIEKYLFQKQKKAIDVSESLKKLIRQRDEKLNQALIMRDQEKSISEICQTLKISPRTLYNYARSKGIEIKRSDKFDKTSWRMERLEKGLCYDCGKPRGPNGTKWRCGTCKEKYNNRKRNRV